MTDPTIDPLDPEEARAGSAAGGPHGPNPENTASREATDMPGEGAQASEALASEPALAATPIPSAFTDPHAPPAVAPATATVTFEPWTADAAAPSLAVEVPADTTPAIPATGLDTGLVETLDALTFETAPMPAPVPADPVPADPEPVMPASTIDAFPPAPGPVDTLPETASEPIPEPIPEPLPDTAPAPAATPTHAGPPAAVGVVPVVVLVTGPEGQSGTIAWLSPESAAGILAAARGRAAIHLDLAIAGIAGAAPAI